MAGLPLAPAYARTRRGTALGPSIESEYLRKPVPRSGSPGNKPLAVPDFGPLRTLRYGTPEEAGLLAEHVGRIDADVTSGMQPSPKYPHYYPGAVALAGRRGVIAHHEGYGYAVKYSDSKPTPLPDDEWVPMRKDTIFDVASVSKLFASMAAVQLIERGQLTLEARVASYIPEFAQNGKEKVTVRHLLTHTSGFIPWISLYSRYETPEERIAAVYALGLEHPPGTTYAYSDFNLITIGKIVEELSSQSLDRFVATNLTEPLGMNDTGYNPSATELDRIAATEYQPSTGRGMVRGSVHDENSYGLNGVAGHAGVFSTAYDLAILAQTILNGGRYGEARILSRQSVKTLLTNYNAAYPGHDHSLSFELYQHWYMDAMATPFTAGHTGFTGTCIVLNPLDRSFAILLTNRVHPSRDWGTILPYRRAFNRNVARAVAVEPAAGKRAWFSGFGDGLDNTLGVSLTLPEGRKKFRFELWYDTHPDVDFAAVEVSTDEGATWESPNGTVNGESSDGRFTGFSGRKWLDADFDLSPYAGPVTLRFRYHTIDTPDNLIKGNGRGVYVDRVRVEGRRRVLFDDRRPRDAALWQPRGWTVSQD